MTDKNIKIEMLKQDMKTTEVAREIGMSEVSFRNKLTGRAKWSLVEAARLRDFFNSRGCNYTIDNLFFK